MSVLLVIYKHNYNIIEYRAVAILSKTRTRAELMSVFVIKWI